MLILERPWTRQPQEPIGINYSGLGRGLQMLLMPIGGRLVDLVSPDQVWTRQADAAIATTPMGVAASLNKADNAYWSITGYPQIVGAKGTFFVWCPRMGTQDSNGAIWFGTSSVAFQESPNNSYSFTAQASSGVLYFNTSVNQSRVYTANTAASSQRMYANGMPGAGSVSGTPAAFAAGAKSLTFGRYVSNTSYNVDAAIVLAGFSSEVWTPQQALSFHINPWQLFAPRRIYIPTASAAASTYTLSTATYAPGSITSSGVTPRVTVTVA